MPYPLNPPSLDRNPVDSDSLHADAAELHAATIVPYDEDDMRVDPTVSCSACDAVCCRLTVVVMPEDIVPRHLVERTAHGLDVMARDEEGWCVAMDHQHMRCSIYEQRPGICRKFAMGSAYCRDEREAYRELVARGIPLTMID